MSDSPLERPENRLAQETSAYLRQHMHNPVDWHPWGDEALARARDEDRPLLVSIGYSACHWCHVMEHESFEDPATAELMNRLFVNIKVDREERPDVDQIYMDTVTRLTGHGGWPLTVFCTPAGEPYYGGTYFPREARPGQSSFRDVLEAVERAYRERRGEVAESASQILASLASQPSGVAGEAPGVATATRAAMKILQTADPEFGGFGTAPKFPTPPNLELLLATSDALPGRKGIEALDHVRLSCREMARRGLYDHLAGGFHRYSVDARWAVPHFEKMLYDQGQLLRVYAELWRRSGCDDDDLCWPVRETAEFLAREMTGPEGGFYASQDADSEGEEGRFYVWTPRQVDAVLGAEAGAAFAKAYGVSERGNFDGGRSVLADVAREPRERFSSERNALAAERAKRIAPATDTKRVAAWNGLTISGLARAGSLLGEEALLAAATAAADFVWEQMRDEHGRLLRIWNQGRAHVSAFLDDHAALLEGCLDLHRAGAGDRFLLRALALADAIAAHFFDDAEGDLFLTPDDGERLVHRPRSDHDGATPNSTGVATLGLFRTAALCGRDELRALADRVLGTHAFVLDRVPEAHPTLARAALAAERGLSVAVIVGDAGDPNREALATRARLLLGPDDAVVVAAPGVVPEGVDPIWLLGRDPQGGASTAWICRGVSCSLPVTRAVDLVPLEEISAS